MANCDEVQRIKRKTNKQFNKVATCILIYDHEVELHTE